MTTHAELKARFDHIPPVDKAVAMHETMRSRVTELSYWFNDLPGGESREKALAYTKLEEALFWINAHIARNVSAVEREAPNADQSV